PVRDCRGWPYGVAKEAQGNRIETRRRAGPAQLLAETLSSDLRKNTSMHGLGGAVIRVRTAFSSEGRKHPGCGCIFGDGEGAVLFGFALLRATDQRAGLARCACCGRRYEFRFTCRYR